VGCGEPEPQEGLSNERKKKQKRKKMRRPVEIVAAMEKTKTLSDSCLDKIERTNALGFIHNFTQAR